MRHKVQSKIVTTLLFLLTIVSPVLGHTGQDQGYYGPGMMWSDGGWMHNGAHMMGYNMWGMGWFGLVFGLTFWVLAVLGVIHLYQKITGQRDESG
ncbi:MAG: hypothetical protein SVU32_02620 [Candidatus Nanohaloarchaea archaeon]|nr:hypothetical protein [Candidatus Nanohaloarchaea archaeon]